MGRRGPWSEKSISGVPRKNLSDVHETLVEHGWTPVGHRKTEDGGYNLRYRHPERPEHRVIVKHSDTGETAWKHYDSEKSGFAWKNAGHVNDDGGLDALRREIKR